MTKVIAGKAKAMRTLPQLMVKAGVKAAAKPILANYKRDTGGDLNLSGTHSSWKFKVPTSVRGSGVNAPVRGRVRIRPAGPASWLNSGTRPRPQGRGRHPGTRGKRTFDEAAPPAIAAAKREVRRVFHDVMG